MSFQPQVDCRLLSTENVRYNSTYLREYKVPDAPENDEAHIHSFYELYVNFSGDVSFLVNNHIYPIKSGDIIFTRPEDVHLCIFHNSCYHEHFCLWIDAPASSPLVSFCHEPDFRNFMSVNEDEKEYFFNLISNLSKGEKEDISVLSTTTIVFQIMNFLETHNDSADHIDLPQLPEEMQQILTYLNNHFDQIQYINEIYDKFYTSPATLTRWFRKYIHLSPKEFLESKKLAYAKKLLRNGCTVTEACMQSGFSSSSYFIAVFKKRFGITPFAYKRDISLHD